MKFTKIFNSKILLILLLTICSQVVHAAPFALEARSLAMGGVSVANADLATAAWANPAMLTNQRPGDDFSLLIGVGTFVRDNDNLRTDIDDFQAANDRLQSAASPTDPEAVQALQEMTNIIIGIDGKNMAVDVSGMAAVGMAFNTFAMALSARVDAIGAGTVENISSSPVDLINQTANTNIVNLEGVIATEFGLSLAKNVRFLNRKLSIGVKPKMVDLQSYIYRESIYTIGGLSEVFDEGKKSDLGTFTSLDLGMAMDLSHSYRIGLNVRNLLSDEFKIANQTLSFDTEARIGMTYHDRMLTVAVDYDLTENEPLLANPSFDNLQTQYLSVGAEFNAFNFAQLRIGARKNLAGAISGGAKDTALTAGIGFWLGFNLDVAATYTDNSVGVFVQTGFRF